MNKVSQLVVTVLDEERQEWERQFVRLSKGHKGKILKNDVAKLAFRAGMQLVRGMSYRQFVASLKLSEPESRKRART